MKLTQQTTHHGVADSVAPPSPTWNVPNEPAWELTGYRIDVRRSQILACRVAL